MAHLYDVVDDIGRDEEVPVERIGTKDRMMIEFGEPLAKTTIAGQTNYLACIDRVYSRCVEI